MAARIGKVTGASIGAVWEFVHGVLDLEGLCNKMLGPARIEHGRNTRKVLKHREGCAIRIEVQGPDGRHLFRSKHDLSDFFGRRQVGV